MRMLRKCQSRAGIKRRQRLTRQRKLADAAFQRALDGIRVWLVQNGYSTVIDENALPGYVLDVPVQNDGTLDLSDISLVRRRHDS